VLVILAIVVYAVRDWSKMGSLLLELSDGCAQFAKFLVFAVALILTIQLN
jgi:hypothetical protein